MEKGWIYGNNPSYMENTNHVKRRSRKRSSSAVSEKMEKIGDRLGKMERYFSTGQSPQRAVAPMEGEEEEDQPDAQFLL